jgi:hypothetical protein
MFCKWLIGRNVDVMYTGFSLSLVSIRNKNTAKYWDVLVTIFLNLELLLRVTYTGRCGVSMVTAHDAHEHRAKLHNHDHTRVSA